MFFDKFNALSQFSYGIGHICESGKNLFSSESKDSCLLSASKIFLGMVELIPVLGIIPAVIDREVNNWTIEDRVAQRELKISNEVESDSFKLQKVYFDTFDSKHSKSVKFEDQLGIPLVQILDNSTPDRQITSLIQDLEVFKNENTLGEADLVKIVACIEKLKAAKEIALRIAVADSESTKVRMDAKNEIVNLIQQQIHNLTNDESMIIPCGYCNGLLGFAIGAGYGHAILLELKKNGDGTFDILVYNTGEGIQNHSRARSIVRTLQYHDIPSDKINDNFFEGLVGFTHCEDASSPEKRHNADSVYNFLKKEFSVVLNM